MVEIFKNSQLPDYFEELDGVVPGDLKDLPRLYESEKVILLRNRRIDFDARFFSSVHLPAERGYKKFKTYQFVEALRRGENIYPTLAQDCFAGDHGRTRYFSEQITSIVDQLCSLLNEAARGYAIEKPRFTLRCAPTFNENLHFDVYKDDIETHHFRVFVNLDSAHRIWHTSWRLSDVLERMGELPRDDLLSLSPGGLVKKLNFHVFGGLNNIYEETGQPRHLAYFDSGEVWFVDSRKIAHQIFYGRRAISSESVVENGRMVDQESHYLKAAERQRKEILAA